MADRRCRDCDAPIVYRGYGRPRVRCTSCSPPTLPAAQNKREAVPPGCPLTPREYEVVGLLASGLTGKQIALQLGTTDSTIRTTLNAAYRRLGVVDRAQAVIACERAGWLGSPAISHSREITLLEEIKRVLGEYVTEIRRAHRHRVTAAQLIYLEAFDQYLRQPGAGADEELTAAFRVVMDEAAVSPAGRQRVRPIGPDLRQAA